MAKIFNFLGADHKVGVTMLVTSLADALNSMNTGRRILVLHMDGREGGEYLPENTDCMDFVWQSLMEGMTLYSEIKELLVTERSVSTLLGCRNNDNAVTYTPQAASHLIATVEEQFDMILIDSGSSIDHNGLAVGAFEYGCPNILVTTQQDGVFDTFIKRQNQVFSRFDTGFDALVINKLTTSTGTFLKSQRENQGRYGFQDSFTVINSPLGWQAESDRRSLYQMRDKLYRKDIARIIDELILKDQ